MLTSKAVTAAVAATTSANTATSLDRPGIAMLVLLSPCQRRADPAPFAMSDTRVAVHARQIARVQHAGDHRLVAVQARPLENVCVLRGDADRFRKVLQGEGKGMMPAVLGLGEVLADDVMGQVTIDAPGRGVMARRPPRVELRSHDVT